MTLSLWSKLFGRRAGVAAPRPATRRGSVRPRLEALEGRLVPSSSRGGSIALPTPVADGVSGQHGSQHGSASGSTGGVASAPVSTSTSGKPIKVDDTVPLPTSAGISIAELFSGYPLSALLGPKFKGDLLVLSNPSAWPFPGNKAPATVVPVLLTGGSAQPGSNPQGPLTLTLTDPLTGAVYTVPVKIVQAPISVR